MTEPIDLVLHCPKCGMQHIDAPDRDSHAWCETCKAPPAAPCYGFCTAWTNPPHKSHLCHGCGHIWRPADVPTNGVRAVLTKGKDDSPIHYCRMGHTHRYVDYFTDHVWSGSKCKYCGDVLPF